MYSIESQQTLLKLCNDLRSLSFVVPEETQCWIEQFRKFVKTKGEDLPMKASRMEYYLKRWPLETNEGAISFAKQEVVMVNNKPLISKFWAMNVESIYMGIKERENLKIKWDNFVVEFRRTAPSGLKSISHSAYNFWPKSEALLRYK